MTLVEPQEHSITTELNPLSVSFDRVRAVTTALCDGLEIEDFVVQSMPDASPAKWHLAHTSWFFEQFLLKGFARDYRSPDPQYEYLFNSYYQGVGPMHARPARGLLTRPTVGDVMTCSHASVGG